MAIITAGVTASWGGTVFGTVVELRSTLGGSLPINRGASSNSLSASVSSGGGTVATTTVATTYVQLNSAYGLDAGTIEVLCLSTANIAFSEWGRKRTIAIGGTASVGGSTVSVLYTTPAICQTLRADARVNDVWRFQGVFKLCKETN